MDSSTNKKDIDRRESNASVPVPVGQRNGSITAYPGTSRRRASMFDPIDPMELQKTLYQNQANVMRPNIS